jgi:plasmid maintenance system antidote protein VapI
LVANKEVSRLLNTKSNTLGAETIVRLREVFEL